MKESSKRKLILPKGDSRLNEFVRQAGPIVSAERGMNERCQLKLKSLANRLKMPAELYDLAIEYFHQSGIESNDELTRWEREFTNFLQKELAQIDQQILSKPLENNLVESGLERFQLKPERARQLVQKEARSAGMLRISLKDAETNLKALVVEQVGRATYLNEEIRQRLFRAGAAWGVDAESVELAIQDVISTNERASKKNTTPLRTLVLGICAILIGTGLYLYSRFNQASIDSNLDSGAAAADRLTELESEPVVLHPEWSDEQTQMMKQLRSRHKFAEEYWNVWVGDDREAKTYLVRERFENSLRAGNSRRLGEFVNFHSVLLQCEPDVLTVKQLADVVSEQINIPFGDLPDDRSKAELTFVANQIGLEIWERLPPGTPAHQAMQESLFSQTAVQAVDGNYIKQSSQSLTNQWWDSVLASAMKEPTRCGGLIPFVFQKSERWLGSELTNERLHESLLAVLQSQPDQWRELTSELSYAIETGSDEQLNDWAELALSAKESPIQNWLVDRLAQRLRLDDGIPLQLKFSQIRTRLTDSGVQPVERYRKHFDSWLKQDVRLQQWLFSNDLAEFEIEEIAVVALWSTQIFALSENRLDLFGLAMDEPAVDLLALAQSRYFGQNRVVFGRASGVAHSSHRESLRQSMGVLGDVEVGSGQKLSSLKRIIGLSERFSDVEFADALTLAKYLLAANTDDEVVYFRQELDKLSRWRNLSLALIELIEQQEDLDHSLSVAGLVFRRQFHLDSMVDWQNELQLQMLQSLSESLNVSLLAEGRNQQELLSSLVEYLANVNRLRLRIVDGNFNEDDDLPEILTQLISTLGGDQESSMLKRAGYLAQNEAHYSVLLGRVLISAAARRARLQHPQIDSRVTTIQSWYNSQIENSPDYFGQLMLNEIVLLKIWSACCQAK